MNWHDQNALARAALDAAKFVTASGHARANCPFCEARVGKTDKKQALGISVRSGFYKCWRCGIRGKLDGKEYVEPANLPPVQQATAAQLGAPEGFYELGIEPGLSAVSFEEAREYLTTPIGCRTSLGEKGRGLADPQVWAEAHIGATLKGRAATRVVVPVLSPEGSWWGWVARTWFPGSDRPYLNAAGMTVGSDGHLFNHAALSVATDTPVLMVEGVFDALAYWPDAVAVLGKPTDAQLDALALALRPVVTALDGDAWREGWAVAMKLRVMGQRAGAVRLPPGKDPDELDKRWVWDHAWESLHA